MKRIVKHYSLHFYFVFFLLSTLDSYCQSIDTEFGKNRVQYTNDFKYWNQYESDHFVAYWYGNGRNIAKTAIQIAEADHDEIRKLIEHKINDKIEIVIYRDQSELKQSNIGVESDFQSKTGETKILGTKMLVYDDGNPHFLRKQIREGIASVYIESLKFGSTFQEFLQNAVLLDLPIWFQKGLISYAGENWNELYDDELRDIILNKKETKSFKKLSTKYPKIIGHSIWTYIGMNYGKSSISDLLYLTRITRDVDQSFKFVLNISKEQLILDWEKFFKSKYEIEGEILNTKVGAKENLKKKSWVPISSMRISPDSKNLAFITNDLGKIKIKIKDLSSYKIQTIYSKGFKNKLQSTEYILPQVCWSANNAQLFYTYQKRDKIYFCKYNLLTNQQETQSIPDKIISVQSMYSIDDRYFILSAFIDGMYDLVIYDTKYREYEKLTSDHFSELDVRVDASAKVKTLVFVSNRPHDHIIPEKPDSSLAIKQFDIFTYDLPTSIEKISDIKSWPKSVTRYTSSELISERYPQICNSKIYFTSPESGLLNLYEKDIESDEIKSISNFNRNIIRAEFSPNADFYFYESYMNGSYEIYRIKIDGKSSAYVIHSENSVRDNSKDKNPSNEQNKVEEGLLFESQFKDPINTSRLIIKKENSQPKGQALNVNSQKNRPLDINEQPFKIDASQIINAGVKFSLFEVATRFDNEVLFEGLELYNESNSGTNPLPMGILAKASITDIFNDYKLEGGMRFPTTFNGSEYFLTFDNNKKRIDKRISLYRRSFTNVIRTQFSEDKSKYETLLGMYRVKYPFNVYSSFRVTASIRSDRSYYKVSDAPSFNAPIVNEKRIGLRLEYVYDNSFNYDINLLHGSRIKVYVDAMNEFNFELIDGFNVDFSKGFTGAIGFDARHYIPILNHMVFAVRGAGATSFGNRRNLYLLGGVANSLFVNFDNRTPIPNQTFGLQTNVNQMRGFDSNIRNGNSYLVSNIELRIPFMKYILGKDKGSSFIKNLQIVGFMDAGLAWYGVSPFSSENPINTINIDGQVIDLEIQYFRDPLVMGVGVGLRTKLLGYFLKLDYAKGIETRKLQDRKLYLSFGLDF